MTKEYEFTIDFEICVSGDSLGKLKLSKLKDKIKKDIEDYMKSNESVANHDIYSFEINKDYEESE